MGDDVADSAEAGDLSLIHFLHAGDALLQCGEDFDALDGVDAKVGLKRH